MPKEFTVEKVIEDMQGKLGKLWDEMSEQDLGQLRAIASRTVRFSTMAFQGRLSPAELEREMKHVDAQWKHIKSINALKVRNAFYETLKEWAENIGKVLSGIFKGLVKV